MGDSEFEWDDEKAESNLKKRRVSFDEAATIFKTRTLQPFRSRSFGRRRAFCLNWDANDSKITDGHSYVSESSNPLNQCKKGNQSRKEKI